MNIDHLITGFDRALRTFAGTSSSSRPNPADATAASATEPTPLSEDDRRHAAGLMRVNHTGEVCAQALYSGQTITSTNEQLRSKLDQAAREETEHLAWTESRLRELNSHRSLLNPVWYAGSFAMGAIAGLAGDRWNLAFLSETERQVEQHLAGHLEDHVHALPADDIRSRAIVEQMRMDEGGHAQMADDAGAERLPLPIRLLMRATAKVMTKTAYRI